MKNFNEFQKAEYEHIAEAHFRTIEAISSFFRYYLLIMSLPISLVTVLALTLSRDGAVRFSFPALTPFIGLVLLVICVVGIGVMLYIINLRMDVILYARAVNAIRKHFYDRAPLSIETTLRSRVLPQTPFQPAYEEIGYFYPVVTTFAIFNTLYFFLGLLFVSQDITLFFDTYALGSIPPLIWYCSVFVFAAHFVLYKRYAHYREVGYLAQRNTVGIDIDGVLNMHREHFCSLLRRNTGKRLKPENIVTLPVHDNPKSKICREDELKVFHDFQYWAEMPPMPHARETIRKLKNTLNMRIILFTHRDWPMRTKLPWQCDLSYAQIKSDWRSKTYAFTKAVYGGSTLSAIEGIIRRIGLLLRVISPIKQITHCWLHKHGLEHEGLLIEKGHENLANPNAAFGNRFHIAKKRNIRFFVEDDLEKAIKMAYICDVVFLMDHPYNKEKRSMELPKNIVRVQSWQDIFRHVRAFS